ncbi:MULTISPECIES: FkbM family methyltransferase [Flavobacterium]|uniref:FkbM family methyltransferase n=1 Tax=Flavobacterium TaxID=237 RepID=UPI001FCBE385|nr:MULTISPECIES: FkbM family methyltransferase [Flavobacterium]UOK43776.1 FkbM family methyltransferase [Flavobacterium enshiense]
MKKVIKKIAIKLINPIATRLGYSRGQKVVFTKNLFDKNSLLEIFFSNIKAMGFAPKHIIDVGANHGTWTRETLKYFPDSYYTLVEPQEWLKPSLQDILDTNSKVSFNAVGAGDKSGSFMFTIVDRDDSCSFRYTEEEAKAGGYQQIEIPIVTLNEMVAKNHSLPFPDLVKIDAEGLDIAVLEGASDLFGRTEVFMVEAAIFNKEFENSLLKMIDYMDKKGYNLFEITDLNRPFQPYVLWLVELAFVKKNGVLDTYKISY